MRRYLLLVVLAVAVVAELSAQTLDVTFRYVKRPGDQFVRVFVPGTMPPGTALDWGPNTNGFISPSAPCLMTYDDSVDAYVKTYTLDIGGRYEYKFHFHFNESGTQWQWISDPLNPETAGPPYNNSVVVVTDPLIFEPALHKNEAGQVTGMSVGIFTTKTVEALSFIAGADSADGMDYLHANGVFYVPFDTPLSPFAGFRIRITIEGKEYIPLDQKAIQIEEAPRPAGTLPGVNIRGNSAVFVVYAPAQPVVQLLVGNPGETFSDSQALTMKKATGEEDVFWLEVPLDPGRYEYQYRLLDGRRISDPLSRRVNNGRTVFDMGPGGFSTADDYVWHDQGFVRPALDTLVIYELHVDDFAAKGEAKGRFGDVAARLDYLAALGINAIELMPIMEFPGNRSWGYNTSHYAAVEATYGTPADFKHLVDEAHRRGIAVILDIVWNHMDGSGPLWQIQPSYEKNPFFKRDDDLRPNETKGSFGGIDLDHFTPQTQAFVNMVHRIWVDEYHVDGFRFDFTRGIGWDLNQPQYGILGWSRALNSYDASLYQIAEHLPADPYLIRISPLDAGWNDSFHDYILKEIHGPTPTMYDLGAFVVGLHEYNPNTMGYADRTQVVKFTVSHDDQSLIQEMVRFAGVPLQTALIRDLFYNTLLFTAEGIPQIWMAQELGMQSGWYDDNHNGNWDEEKLGYRPVDWSLFGTERGQRHYRRFQLLIKLRKRVPALFRGQMHQLSRYNAQRVLVYGYTDDQEQAGDVVVVANFSGKDQTVRSVPWLGAGSWRNAVDSTLVTAATDTLDSLHVPAYTASVFLEEQATGIAAHSTEKIPEKFSLQQNYPNPFNPVTSIEFSLPKSTRVSLKVYSALGEEVATLVDGILPAGTHHATWNAANQPSGVYYYRLKAGQYSSTRKMLLLR